MRTVLLFLVLCPFIAVAAEPAPLRVGPHPRLLVTDARLAAIAAAIPGDPRLARLVAAVEASATALLPQAPLERVLVGDKRKRLLGTSRQAVSRVLTLGLMQRLHPRPELRQRLVQELLALCAFSDWHPDHFLDTAEMTAAVAIGYDWLFAELEPAQRTLIRQALIEKGLRPGQRPQGWVAGDNNWNQVCHGGLVCGALAVAEDEPALAQELIARARAHIGGGLHAYVPAGAYPEGPGYWDYGTSYSVLTAAALTSALGDDAGIAAAPGFAASFDYLVHATGPTGLVFNYADGGPLVAISPMHFWAAGVYGRPDLAQWCWQAHERWLDGREVPGERQDNLAGRFLPLAVAWYVPPMGAPARREWWAAGDGRVHLALMRSGWDAAASFAGIKGGRLRVNHGHLDAGGFVFDAAGVRWAHELGMEREIYDRNDSWGTQQDSPRWRFLRANNHGHNVLTIGDALQQVEGVSPLTRVFAADDRAHAIVDLSAAYHGQAASARRGLALIGGRRHLLVQDELTEVTASLTWTMITRATATIAADGRSAVLSEAGKRLGVHLVSAPPEARLVVEDVTPPAADENPNQGFRRLCVQVPAAPRASLTLSVMLVVDDGALPALPAGDLESWAGGQP